MSQVPPDSNNPQPPPPGAPSPIPKEIRTWAMMLHFSAILGLLAWIPASPSMVLPFVNIICPLVLWLLKREEHPFLNDQGREVVNFHITLGLVHALGVVTFCAGGFVLTVAAFFIGMVLSIVGGVKANDGLTYRYPLALRLIN